jgi:hypothetical protein
VQIVTAKGAKPVLHHLAQSQDRRQAASGLEPCAQLEFQSMAFLARLKCLERRCKKQWGMLVRSASTVSPGNVAAATLLAETDSPVRLDIPIPGEHPAVHEFVQSCATNCSPTPRSRPGGPAVLAVGCGNYLMRAAF